MRDHLISHFLNCVIVMTTYKLPIKVFDFFSGCGGTSKGFQKANLETVFAIDNDPYAAKTFLKNFSDTKLFNTVCFNEPFPKKVFLLKEIESVPLDAIAPIIQSCIGHPILFTGCAPCQPFSNQKTQLPAQDPRRSLLDHFRRFVEHYQPEFVFVENVPGMQKIQGKAGPFNDFLNTLDQLEYYYKYKIVAAQKYGVPQKRRRLILIASRLGKIDFPKETHGPGTFNPKYSTPREWMTGFPPIEAGETHPSDPNHQAGALSALNIARIKATPEGGDRRDWPEELRLACHTNGYTGHSDVYGRIKWDDLSSCLTTKCTSLSNGKFGHPEQHRAISAREAACLQTFPRNFVFEGGLSLVSRQIGNAVPVLLAKHFGENFNSHLQAYLESVSNG